MSEENEKQEETSISENIALIRDWNIPDKLALDSDEKKPDRDYYYARKDPQGMAEAKSRHFERVNPGNYPNSPIEHHDLFLMERPIGMAKAEAAIHAARTDLLARDIPRAQLEKSLIKGAKSIGQMNEYNRSRQFAVKIDLKKKGE